MCEGWIGSAGVRATSSALSGAQRGKSPLVNSALMSASTSIFCGGEELHLFFDWEEAAELRTFRRVVGKL